MCKETELFKPNETLDFPVMCYVFGCTDEPRLSNQISDSRCPKKQLKHEDMLNIMIIQAFAVISSDT